MKMAWKWMKHCFERQSVLQQHLGPGWMSRCSLLPKESCNPWKKMKCWLIITRGSAKYLAYLVHESLAEQSRRTHGNTVRLQTMCQYKTNLTLVGNDRRDRDWPEPPTAHKEPHDSLWNVVSTRGEGSHTVLRRVRRSLMTCSAAVTALNAL